MTRPLHETCCCGSCRCTPQHILITNENMQNRIHQECQGLTMNWVCCCTTATAVATHLTRRKSKAAFNNLKHLWQHIALHLKWSPREQEAVLSQASPKFNALQLTSWLFPSDSCLLFQREGVQPGYCQILAQCVPCTFHCQMSPGTGHPLLKQKPKLCYSKLMRTTFFSRHWRTSNVSGPLCITPSPCIEMDSPETCWESEVLLRVSLYFAGL
jgi:hypothetical protein